MKHLIFCAVCAFFLSAARRPGGEECQCTLPPQSDVAMNKAYDETALGNGGFKLTTSGEGWCDDLALQRRLIENTLRRSSVATSACHQMIKAERNGHTVTINYFTLSPDEVEKVRTDLARRKKGTLADKKRRFEMLCLNDYVIVATSDGHNDTELKAVMVLLGVDAG